MPLKPQKTCRSSNAASSFALSTMAAARSWLVCVTLAPGWPAHLVQVQGFWMDEHDVTNAEFSKFVEATGYVTTAELKIDWEDLKKEVPPGTPKPDDSTLAPGSLVFTPTSGPVHAKAASLCGAPFANVKP